MEQLEKTYMPQYKYNHSAKGIARYKRYDLSEKGRVHRECEPARHRMNRIRHSEEMGCSQFAVDILLPAHRFIKALEELGGEHEE